jgi:hypothetical protein
MTERSDSPERLFQQLDDLVADIIDQFASQGMELASSWKRARTDKASARL